LEWEANDEAKFTCEVVTSLDRSLLQSGCKIRLNSPGDRWSDFTQSLHGEQSGDWAGLQVQLERELQRSIRRELHCQPSVTLLMQTPDEPVKSTEGRRRRRTAASVAS